MALWGGKKKIKLEGMPLEQPCKESYLDLCRERETERDMLTTKHRRERETETAEHSREREKNRTQSGRGGENTVVREGKREQNDRSKRNTVERGRETEFRGERGKGPLCVSGIPGSHLFGC